MKPAAVAADADAACAVSGIERLAVWPNRSLAKSGPVVLLGSAAVGFDKIAKWRWPSVPDRSPSMRDGQRLDSRARCGAVAGLPRTAREIERLSDHELTDIGLASDEIHHLRRRDVFRPMGWCTTDIAGDQLPY